MLAVQPPALLRALLPGAVWRMPGSERSVYLTFDDGPCPEVTPWVLDTLERFNALASFFLIGANAERSPGLVERIRAAGHAIGNHTHHHLNGWRSSMNDYVADIERAQAHIGTNLFRPPYGRIRPDQLRKVRRNRMVVMWDVLSMDYDASIPPDKCIANVMKHARAGSIIVFHDSLKAERNLRHALPATLQSLADQGFAFKALPEGGLTAAPK